MADVPFPSAHSASYNRGMSGNSTESPGRPTGIHYALVVVVLLSVVSACGWFLADHERRKLAKRNLELVAKNAQLEEECSVLRLEVELQIEHRSKLEQQQKKQRGISP